MAKRAFLARRQDALGDRFGARQRYEKFVEAVGKEDVSKDVGAARLAALRGRQAAAG